MKTNRRETSSDLRDRVVKTWKNEKDNGLSFTKLAEQFNLKRSTVFKIVQRYQLEGRVENKPGRGGKKKLTDAEARAVVKTASKNPSKSAPMISQELEKSFGKTVTAKTILNYVRRAGLQASSIRKEQLIKNNRKKRLQSARQNLKKNAAGKRRINVKVKVNSEKVRDYFTPDKIRQVSKKLCLICGEESREDVPSPDLFRCAPRELSKCVQVYFILSKVINLPEAEVALYLQQYPNLDTLITFCNKCSAEMEKCLELHLQLRTVERRFKEETRKVRNAMKATIDKPLTNDNCFDAASTLFGRVRNFVYNRSYPDDAAIDPCIQGNVRATELALLSISNPLEQAPVDIKVDIKHEEINFHDYNEPTFKEEDPDWTGAAEEASISDSLPEVDDSPVRSEETTRVHGLRKRPPPKSHPPAKHHCCSSCDQIFPTQVKLKEHRKDYHTILKPFSCDLCSFQTIKQCHLREHKKKVHEIVESYPCYKCSQVFQSTDTLKEHMSSGLCELRIGDHCWRCDKCSKTFNQLSVLKHHILYRHSGHFAVCELCGYKTAHPKCLKNHQKRYHGTAEDLKEFTCPICNKIVCSKFHLRKHMEICDPQKRDRHQCETCGKQFCSEDNLKNHLAKDHDVEEFQKFTCKMEYCGKKFYTKHLLASHEIWCSGEKEIGERNFLCKFCPRKFVAGKELKCHLRRLHGQKNLLKKSTGVVNRGTGRKIRLSGLEHPCKWEGCGKIFYSRTQLRNHKIEMHWVHKVGNGYKR